METAEKNQVITRDHINNAFTYREYREMIDSLLKQGKTTGENHSEEMIHYTNMNVHRMNRLDKRTELNEELVSKLKEIERQQVWLLLTEAWCGDAAQSVPVINKIAEVTDNIHLKLLLRDENLDIMDQFLQRGRSRSIPKLIMLDAETLEVLGDWGPRPAEAQELYDTMKASGNVAKQEAAEHLHKWYADNKSQQIQKEIAELL